MSTADIRVRQALDQGRAPSTDDIAELLTELDRVRRESEERWQAIGRLAPAAKAHRARSQAQTRALSELGRHLDALDAALHASGPLDRQALAAWLRRARELLDSQQS